MAKRGERLKVEYECSRAARAATCAREKGRAEECEAKAEFPEVEPGSRGFGHMHLPQEHSASISRPRARS